MLLLLFFFLRDFNVFIMVQVCTEENSRSGFKIVEIGKYIMIVHGSARDHYFNPSCLIFFFYSHGVLQILIITPSLLNPPCPSADRITGEHNKLQSGEIGNTPSKFLLTPLKPSRHWYKIVFLDESSPIVDNFA